MEKIANPATITRRRFLASAGRIGMALPLVGLTGFGSCSGGKSRGVPATPAVYQGGDEQLLDEIQKTAFQFFWEQAHPQTGLIKDRANVSGSDSYTVASIASVGYGLTALCIADARGYAASEEIKKRVRLTLNTMLSGAAGHEGGRMAG